jgi:GNAT superfamily N-acetyltransferase
MRRLHIGLFTGGRNSVPSMTEGCWWLVDHPDENHPVAFAGLYVSKYYCKTIYLCRAAVAWEHRGQGLQKRLIRVRLHRGRCMGMDWAVTDTERKNYPSANSLISCGFRLFKPWSPWATYGNGLYWGRRLNNDG